MFHKPLEKYLLPTWTISFVFPLSIHWDKAAINPRVNSLSSISRSISLTQTQASLCALTLLGTYFWRKKKRERVLTLNEAFQSFARWSRTESSACLQLRHDETKLRITRASSITHDLIKRRNPEESISQKNAVISVQISIAGLSPGCVLIPGRREVRHSDESGGNVSGKVLQGHPLVRKNFCLMFFSRIVKEIRRP